MFLFGKKRRRTKRKTKKTGRKPPARLIKLCRKYKIKCTKKVGKRRVYKAVSILKRQLKRKQKQRKVRRSAAFGKRRRSNKTMFGKRRRSNKTMFGKRRRSNKTMFGKRRKYRFGNVATNASSTSPVSNYGYNQKVMQTPGVLSQSSQVITEATNANRPPGFGVDPSQLPIYGVYRPFFTENVPTTVGPSWNFMGQPDGSSYPVGGPFNKFSKFGKKGRRRFGTMSYEEALKREKALQTLAKFRAKHGKGELSNVDVPDFDSGYVPRYDTRKYYQSYKPGSIPKDLGYGSWKPSDFPEKKK